MKSKKHHAICFILLWRAFLRCWRSVQRTSAKKTPQRKERRKKKKRRSLILLRPTTRTARAQQTQRKTKLNAKTNGEKEKKKKKILEKAEQSEKSMGSEFRDAYVFEIAGSGVSRNLMKPIEWAKLRQKKRSVSLRQNHLSDVNALHESLFLLIKKYIIDFDNSRQTNRWNANEFRHSLSQKDRVEGPFCFSFHSLNGGQGQEKGLEEKIFFFFFLCFFLCFVFWGGSDWKERDRSKSRFGLCPRRRSRTLRGRRKRGRCSRVLSPRFTTKTRLLCRLKNCIAPRTTWSCTSLQICSIATFPKPSNPISKKSPVLSRPPTTKSSWRCPVLFFFLFFSFFFFFFFFFF